MPLHGVDSGLPMHAPAVNQTEPSQEIPMTTAAPVRLAGRTLKENRHICAFFHSKEEQNKVLMPFFREGFERGEKLFHVVDGRQRDAHLRACRDSGIDLEACAKTDQLEVRTWEEAYLRDGQFDGERMIRILKEVVEANRAKYGLTRLMGNMEWALETVPGVTDIVEYETKLNFLSPQYPDPIVCVYDLNRHSGSVVMDILRTHPMVIIGGMLQENPLYVPPGEFLRELQERRQVTSATIN
jgi:hypothetical protein